MVGESALGKWLKERSQQEHLSLRKVGEKAGISHATVHTIIKGGHATAETVTKLAHAFSNDGNRKIALEDELLILAGYRSSQEQLSQPVAELLDIVKDFGVSQLKVVSAFAEYLIEGNHNEQK